MESVVKKIQRNDKQGLLELFSEKGDYVYKNVIDRLYKKEAAQLITKQVISELYKIIHDNKNLYFSETTLNLLFIKRIEYYCGKYTGLLKTYYEPFADGSEKESEEEKDPVKISQGLPLTPKEETVEEKKPMATSEGEPFVQKDAFLGEKKSAPIVHALPSKLPGQEKQKKHTFHWGFFLLIVFFFFLLWAIAGMLMNMGIIPSFNLGYSWFNRTFFTLF